MPEPDDGFGLRGKTRSYLHYVTNQKMHMNEMFYHTYIYIIYKYIYMVKYFVILLYILYHILYYIIYYIIYILFMGRDSSLGIATRYRLDGQGIESRWGGEIFRTRPDRL